MPLRLQIASETPAYSWDNPVGPFLNSDKFTLLSQPGKHLGQIDEPIVNSRSEELAGEQSQYKVLQG